MSILIQGMEMPKSCIACLLNFGEKRPEYGLTIYCPYSDGVISWRDIPWRDKAFDNGRLASCGIVSVPSHGRLIDADELKKKHHWTDDFYETEYVEVEDIDAAPTVIPAEPREEETE